MFKGVPCGLYRKNACMVVGSYFWTILLFHRRSTFVCPPYNSPRRIAFSSQYSTARRMMYAKYSTVDAHGTLLLKIRLIISSFSRNYLLFISFVSTDFSNSPTRTASNCTDKKSDKLVVDLERLPLLEPVRIAEQKP